MTPSVTAEDEDAMELVGNQGSEGFGVGKVGVYPVLPVLCIACVGTCSHQTRQYQYARKEEDIVCQTHTNNG